VRWFPVNSCAAPPPYCEQRGTSRNGATHTPMPGAVEGHYYRQRCRGLRLRPCRPCSKIARPNARQPAGAQRRQNWTSGHCQPPGRSCPKSAQRMTRQPARTGLPHPEHAEPPVASACGTNQWPQLAQEATASSCRRGRGWRCARSEHACAMASAPPQKRQRRRRCRSTRCPGSKSTASTSAPGYQRCPAGLLAGSRAPASLDWVGTNLTSRALLALHPPPRCAPSIRLLSSHPPIPARTRRYQRVRRPPCPPPGTTAAAARSNSGQSASPSFACARKV